MTAQEWGIPTLDLNRQAMTLVSPILPYGSFPRYRKTGGTIHFYISDQKFTRLFANPSRILQTGCSVAFEPNCTTGPTVPRAAALFGIYRKRAVACHWQAQGLDVVVDLNVCDDAIDLALLGVPKGWRSYATRAHRGDSIADHERRYQMGVSHGESSEILFVVVGGGKVTKAACRERGWTHVPEYCRVVRGEEEADGGFG